MHALHLANTAVAVGKEARVQGIELRPAPLALLRLLGNCAFALLAALLAAASACVRTASRLALLLEQSEQVGVLVHAPARSEACRRSRRPPRSALCDLTVIVILELAAIVIDTVHAHNAALVLTQHLAPEVGIVHIEHRLCAVLRDKRRLSKGALAAGGRGLLLLGVRIRPRRRAPLKDGIDRFVIERGDLLIVIVRKEMLRAVLEEALNLLRLPLSVRGRLLLALHRVLPSVL